MANYRPKSLDELNNLYGKSLNAQQEIVKKATVLEEKTQPKETPFVPENTQLEAKNREQEANDQISGYVNDFIKSFGTPVKPDRTAVATVTASMKTVPIGKPAAPVKENEAVKAAAENQSEDKPRLIRNSERNSLFENYKKVMDDEDDYDFSEPEKDKRKPKKLFEKKSVKPDAEEKPEEATEEKKAEAENKEEPKPAEAPVKEAAPVKSSALEETEIEAKEEDEASEEKPGKKKRSKVKKEKAPKEKKVKAEKQTHGTVSRAVVMFLIFCVLMSATAVGAVKAFSGINTSELVVDKYRLYTADREYSRLGIADGDLVVVEHKGIDYNDVFAYEKNPGEYNFARLTTVLNDESVIADDGDLRCLVFNDSVRGVVCKTIPGVGAVAAVIMSDFIIILGALLLIAVILMLVAVFACKPKQKKEKPEKAKKEKKAKPEKVKKEKKSKKSKKSEIEDFSDEDLQPQEAVANEDGDEDDYDAIEADFSFLLQDYIGDEEVEEEVEAEEYEGNEAEAEYEPEAESPTEEPAEEEPAVKYEISDQQDDEITE